MALKKWCGDWYEIFCRACFFGGMALVWLCVGIAIVMGIIAAIQTL